jgi:hypothetical protein
MREVCSSARVNRVRGIWAFIKSLAVVNCGNAPECRAQIFFSYSTGPRAVTESLTASVCSMRTERANQQTEADSDPTALGKAGECFNLDERLSHHHMRETCDFT